MSRKVTYKRGPYRRKVEVPEVTTLPEPITETSPVDDKFALESETLFPIERVSYARRKNTSTKLDLLIERMEKMSVSKDVCITIPNSLANEKEAKSLFSSAKKHISRKSSYSYTSNTVFNLEKKFQVLRIWRIA